MQPGPIIVAVVVSILITLVLLPQLMRLSYAYDLLDQPGRHKRHKRPVPVLGGVGLFAAVWLTVGVSILSFGATYAELLDSLLYVFLGALLIFLVGLSDDLKPLSAWVKLAAQLAAGLVLYLGGLKINPVSIPFDGSIDIGAFSAAITVLWVVALTNAINIVDGLDGLAAGVSLIGAITLVTIGELYHLGGELLFAYALIGFLFLFLFYNRYPARIFLGDSGSMQIGYYFAVISLLVPLKSYTAAALYVPLLALAVPLLEAVVSVFRRLAAGRSIMQADRRHLFHYLAYAGFSPRQIVFIFYGLSVAFGLFALAMFFWNRLVVFGVLVLFMVVISVIFLILLTDLSRTKRLDRWSRRGS
jgi:UDP-GlcNAc:undecaprenyl-phosphate GlcNAc-1-phosphate transferase